MDAPRAHESFPRINAAQVIACGIVAASIGWSVWLLRDRPLNDEVELLPRTVLPSSEMAIAAKRSLRVPKVGGYGFPCAGF